jgi:hypothetical protein
LIFVISFGFAMVNYYDTPVPGLGRGHLQLQGDKRLRADFRQSEHQELAGLRAPRVPRERRFLAALRAPQRPRRGGS